MTSQQLLACADVALYEAKNNGKNRVELMRNVERNSYTLKANQMIGSISQAIRNQRFILHYQPICSLEGGILHYEALIRMQDDKNNLVVPAEFIPLAERCGLMGKIDKWVVSEVLERLKMRQNIHIFVNLSGTSLGDDRILEEIEQMVGDSGIDARRIGFEITETSAVKNLEQAAC